MADRESPRDVVRVACATYGEDVVVDWCVAFLTGEITGEAAYGAELPKLVAITGSENPGGWKAPVDPVNYYWIRVWAARVFLYVWRDDVVDALQQVADDPAWRVREHIARITAQRELGQLVDALLPMLDHELPRVRTAAVRAIGAAGEYEHAAAIRPLADDPDQAVRAAVERALTKLEERLDRPIH
ncbi:HEAT repeat domain-containing protein [Kribbella sindirgiensis]|uniref:HEAT repeat domain-containing protein n=1 Tax=Kribbella sindirgiensis TaxID=1124744 RepID=A0A4R0ICJ5_9ACTN|nr:HEAT repeat domain-containing protein [Kribbella sindirgiensis]TCC21339.1 HEAT repeat domain-containing protein [Kribbella sindirgiensis]